MARDHRKLRVFHDGHALTLDIYKQTRHFPKDEWFGLRAQLRRAAVSIPSNLVEGSARHSTREYFNFLNIARASAAEVLYLLALCFELKLLANAAFSDLRVRSERLNAGLEALVQQVDLLRSAERETRRRARRLKTTAPSRMR